MFINLAICGQTVEGKDATNDISRMCIQACRELKLITPSVSVKCFDGTTDEVLMDALEATIEHKGGMPAFYNDKAFIKILREMGVAEEDLVDWCRMAVLRHLFLENGISQQKDPTAQY